MGYVDRAEWTLSLVDRALFGTPYTVVGSFSGDRNRFRPGSDLDVAVREANVQRVVELLRAALGTRTVEETNCYRSPIRKKPWPGMAFLSGSEYMLHGDHTPVHVIGSLEN